MDHFGSVEDWLFRNKKHSTAKFLLKLLFSNKDLILRRGVYIEKFFIMDHFGSVEDWLFRNKKPSTAKFVKCCHFKRKNDFVSWRGVYKYGETGPKD